MNDWAFWMLIADIVFCLVGVSYAGYAYYRERRRIQNLNQTLNHLENRKR